MHAQIIETLARQAQNDLEGVLSNPIWHQIYDKNPGFADNLPATLKLELLRYVHAKWDGFEIPDKFINNDPESEDEDMGDEIHADYFQDMLCDITVDVDPWETGDPGVIYPVIEDRDKPHKIFDLGFGWTAAFSFEGPDLSMEDVGYGCDERFSLSSLLPIYFSSPSQDIRVAAQSCGIGYEPEMSPTDGSYFRLSRLNLYFNCELTAEVEAGPAMQDYFDNDSALAKRIKESADHCLSIAQIKKQGWQESLPKPVFEKGPQVKNEESITSFGAYSWWSESGRIDVAWDCGYWIPSKPPKTIESLSKNESLAYQREELAIEFSAFGETSCDYEINYKLRTVADLNEAILSSLESKEALRLGRLYLFALGLIDLRLM